MADDISQYPAYLTAILYQLALLGCLSKSVLQNNLRALNISPVRDRAINPAEMTKALNVLLKDGWLQKKGTDWQLTADHENAVFLWLLAHQDAYQTVKKGLKIIA